MSDSPDAARLWQSQTLEATDAQPDLREKASTLRWETRRRTKAGAWWAAYFILLFGWNVWHAGNAAEVAGNLLCASAAVFMALQWRRFGVTADLPLDLPVMAFLAAYRAELVRQKHAARVVGLWSLMPLVLGVTLAGAGHLAARHGLNGRSVAMMLAFASFIMAFGWIMSALQAQQVQFRIDEVDAALRESQARDVLF